MSGGRTNSAHSCKLSYDKACSMHATSPITSMKFALNSLAAGLRLPKPSTA
jgi:hypothetical protein